MTAPDKDAARAGRETRLINKIMLDDPNEPLEAGSTVEFDLLCEWSRDELAETVQTLDAENDALKAEMRECKLDAFDRLAAMQTERDSLRAEVERLRAALIWYNNHWGTNNENIRTEGYTVAEQALGQSEGGET